jgi:hypothetical protein
MVPTWLRLVGNANPLSQSGSTSTGKVQRQTGRPLSRRLVDFNSRRMVWRSYEA